MTLKQQITFFSVIFVMVGSFIYMFWPDLKSEFKEKEVILASIKLDNLCSFQDDVFIVVNDKTGKSSKFRNGIAYINVKEDGYVRLALSPEYSNFRYDGTPEPVKKKMTMVADCNSSPRMQMIMDSMNKSFSN
ncbi:MAG: hypothetical protein VYE27_04935 [Pseudomonadota bacterium]|nr:hypothetical protein [Pseudomonadota bacterium]